MKKTALFSIIMLVFSLALLPACKGNKTTTSAPTVATISLASEMSGTISDSTIISGYDVTITLPAGVTAKKLPSGMMDNGVVAGSGAGTNAVIAATYTEATGTTPGKIRVAVAKGGDLGSGKFITISTNIIPGYCPSIPDFPPPTFTASGFDTATQSTVSVTGKVILTETVSMNGTCEGSTDTGSDTGTNADDTTGADVGGSPNSDTGTGTGTGTGTAAPAACTYTYSAWTECDATGNQTRTVQSKSPDGCQGTPELSQFCEAPSSGPY